LTLTLQDQSLAGDLGPQSEQETDRVQSIARAQLQNTHFTPTRKLEMSVIRFESEHSVRHVTAFTPVSQSEMWNRRSKWFLCA
jgi:hypothetical protein